MENTLKKHLLIALLALMGSVQLVYAQNRTISGTVVDELNEPIIGASVVANQGNAGAVTNFEGKFQLSLPAGAKKITVSYIGYESQVIDATNKNVIDVTLKEDHTLLDEVVVVGYGTQKKASLTGSVVAIGHDELITTKSNNVQNMMTGKLPGVRVVQKTSEPGEFTNHFDIRGFGSPLLVVDGVPRGDMERMDPNDIESISIIKDGSAAVYGVRAGNGVVLITTKKGQKGKAKIEYSMYYGIQTPAEVLQPVNAFNRATLFNETTMRHREAPSLTYDDQYFADLASGKMPDTDWYNHVLRSSAPQQQHNVSISGGSEKIDYYVNFGYTDQESFLKTNSSNYNRYNLRSNLNAQITNNLKASVKLHLMMDENNRQNIDTYQIFSTLWRSQPNNPLYTNDTAPYYYHPDDVPNVVPLIDTDLSGYYQRKKNLVQTNMELEYTIPGIKGLTAKGLFSFDKSFNDDTRFQKEYNEYRYTESNDQYQPYVKNSKMSIRRAYSTSFTRLWNISLNYEKSFANHNVKALVLYEEQYSQGNNFNARRELELAVPYLFAGNSENQEGNGGGLDEYAARGLVGRINYDYANKYLLEFGFRYDGSSKFPSELYSDKPKQWGLFPTVSVAWRIAEESFIKDNLSMVDNLKLRFAYGELGDDGASNYQFVSGYDYPLGGGGKTTRPRGYVFGDNFVNALGFRNAPNPYITWYTVKTLNLALEADLWNGLFGFTAELFQRTVDGIFANPVTEAPDSFGTGFAQQNLNKNRNRGFELELRHRNRIGDFKYNITGFAAITRETREVINQTPRSHSYDYWRNNQIGRYNDIWFGYGDGGRYYSYEDIENSLYANAGTLPGDYIYEDWNGDGVIDDRDMHPIATKVKDSSNNDQNRPLMNLGLTLSGDYKGFDFNLLFQGAAMSYVSYGEQLLEPLAWNGNALDHFLDRWRPADPKQDPYNPATQWVQGYYAYGKIRPDVNSEFCIQNGSYLRLKNAEIGYTLPKSWLSKIGVQRMRVYVNAYNLLTITDVKGVDPEKPFDMNGYLYPLNRTYNFGASITF